MSVHNIVAFRDLKIVALDPDRSHAIANGMVRIVFRLSGTPPLGWSYTFMRTWEAVVYPLKRSVGVDGDSVWIDCIADEVGTYHLERLEGAIEQVNRSYREEALRQATHASHALAAEAELRAKLADMSQTLYPQKAAVAPAGGRRGMILEKLRRLVFPGKRRRTEA